MPIVYSTLASNNIYAVAVQGPDKNSPHRFADKILIKGGAGVANKHFITPKGVATKVTDKELETLKANRGFQDHMKAGFITFETSNHEAVEKAVKNMNLEDKSAPINENDFKDLVEAGTEDTLTSKAPVITLKEGATSKMPKKVNQK